MANVIHLRVRRDGVLGTACSEKTAADADNTTRNVDKVTCKRCLKKLGSGVEIINPSTKLPY